MKASLDISLRKYGLTGPDDECGDTGVVLMHEDLCFLALIDALGHGKQAYETAVLAENYLRESAPLERGEEGLVSIMSDLHDHLKGSRGAVAGLCRIDLASGELRYVGIGNISARIYRDTRSTLISRDGVIGYSMVSPKVQQALLVPGDILILSSDGVKEQFLLEDYPGLLKGNAEEISGKIISELGKGTDDVSCLVVRVKG